MRIKHVVFVGLVCLAGAISALAQSVPPPPPPALPMPSPQSAVHVTTRIVQVSVTVHDDRGRPVTGLTKDDFVLFDQNQRQQIASFSDQRNLVTTTHPTASNIFTNRFEQGAAQPLLTVIVMDSYNTRKWDLTWCRGSFPLCAVGRIFDQVEKFISQQMQPQDRVALYELSDKLYLLQDFTSDTSALRRPLDRGRQYVLAFPPPQIGPMMDGMHAIADRLAKVPGRKNLIWLSTSFPPRGVITNDRGMGEIAKTLDNVDHPLSAIDAKGLIPEFPGGGPLPGGGGGGARAVSGVELPSPASGNYGQTATRGRQPRILNFELTKVLADMSGGRAYYDTNDFAGAIRKVIDDSASTYTLGYYPDHNKWNGEFHEIKVKVNRPGLEVRARKGYYAVANTASVTDKDAEKLADAIHSPLESTDLGFDVQADGVEIAGVHQLKVKIALDSNQLRFQQQSDRATDSLSETWAEFNSEGKQVGEISKTINLSRSESEYEKLLHEGFTFSKTLVLAKDAAEVRLVLRDAGNGAIGSVIIPLSRLFGPKDTQSETKQ